jgi:cytoskeletal protein CcmA (bactofilin family)
MNRKKTIQRIGVIFIFSLLLLILAAPVQAFEPISGERVVIEQGQVINDDLYVGANVFILRGTVRGDLVAAGSVIVIEPGGVVTGDLLGVAQGVAINGKVEGDARLAAAVISVGEGGEVGEDLLGFGYSIQIGKGSTVGGDLVAYGSQVAIDGVVDKDVRAGGNGVSISGQVGGDANIDVATSQNRMLFNPFMFMAQEPEMPGVPTIPGGFTLDPNARIDGDLTYTSSKIADIPSGVVGRETTHHEPIQPAAAAKAPPTPEERIGAWFIQLLRILATLYVMGFLLSWLAPNLLQNGVSIVKARPWQALLWGIVAYFAFFFLLFLVIVIFVILIFILAIITLGDLVGVMISVSAVIISSLLLIFKLSVSYVSKIVILLLVGRWLLARLNPGLEGHRFWPLALGIFLFGLVWSIPFLGGLVNIVVILFGLGGLWMLGVDWWQAWIRSGKTPAPAETPVEE